MTDDPPTHSVPPLTQATLRRKVMIAGRLVADLLVVGLWVVLVTLLALGATWSRWQFYSLLLLGVICYVRVTAPWDRRRGG
ncbi:hypothetical protein [Natrinema amylolyticum]|uniref:hypothetical protein n=1 Tax=Natrinema amylolyticum TaxID=2878679 RepID=UPI001CFB8C13|nr:hypothetical protein [Natrinema amylolyticum]